MKNSLNPILVAIAIISLGLALYSTFVSTTALKQIQVLQSTVANLQYNQTLENENYVVERSEIIDAIGLQGEAIDELYENQITLANELGLETNSDVHDEKNTTTGSETTLP